MHKRIALCALMLTMAVAAQTPPTPPTPPVDLVKTYLTLTDQQITQLQQIRQAERTANQTIQQSMQQKQQQLNTLLTGGSTDAAAIGRLMIDIRNLRKQIETNHTTFHNQALNVLNATQKPKAQALEDAAKLAPTIHQAAALGLVLLPAPPAGGPGGPGAGPRPMRMRQPPPEF
ncbi:MAG: periplasmic heavy metal sensor [Acidobacteria bacterium]|nr:periplasmic heavy metal sensor [Acidobacteriota bacterium]